MNTDAMLAKYKEAAVRADDTIDALNEAVKAQREIIDLLHAKIGQMERELAETKMGLR